MIKKSLITVLSIAALSTGFTSPVAASGATNDFGTCLNPQVKSSQVNEGSRHGVVGTTKLYAGTDTIYKLSQGNVMQCLCQDNGRGIQTNWLKIGKMPKKDSENLKHKGWTYIITGSTWGLSDEPYLAKNIEYICRGTVVTETKVKGLATTGNSVAIYGLVLAGITSLIAGLLLKKVTK